MTTKDCRFWKINLQLNVGRTLVPAQNGDFPNRNRFNLSNVNRTTYLLYTLRSSGVQGLISSLFYRHIAPLERKSGKMPDLRVWCISIHIALRPDKIPDTSGQAKFKATGAMLVNSFISSLAQSLNL